jgi:hypothetical protein
MFSEIYELLLGFKADYLTVADWKSIFDYKWDREEDYCGYGLFDGKKVVGFVGLIFSKRLIDDKMEHFCNVTSWIVRKEYRGHSLFLLQPVLKFKNCTITDFTPSRAVYAIEKKLGFRELDSRLKILWPFNVLRKGGNSSNSNCTEDKGLIKKILNDNDRKLFHDHMRYTCRHLLTYDNNEYCYIVYTRVKGSKIPYYYILYISNPKLFSKYSNTIRCKIVSGSKTPFILVDSRLIHHVKLPFSFNLPFRSIKLYKSSRLQPEKIDNLYSELVLLDLSTIPAPLEIWRDLLH